MTDVTLTLRRGLRRGALPSPRGRGGFGTWPSHDRSHGRPDAVSSASICWLLFAQVPRHFLEYPLEHRFHRLMQSRGPGCRWLLGLPSARRFTVLGEFLVHAPTWRSSSHSPSAIRCCFSRRDRIAQRPGLGLAAPSDIVAGIVRGRMALGAISEPCSISVGPWLVRARSAAQERGGDRPRVRHCHRRAGWRCHSRSPRAAKVVSSAAGKGLRS